MKVKDLESLAEQARVLKTLKEPEKFYCFQQMIIDTGLGWPENYEVAIQMMVNEWNCE